MDLFEYQARDMFEAGGVPVLPGIVADTPAEVEAAARTLGTPVVVVKAQVKAGGRGKAGGVKIAKSPAEAAEVSKGIFGLDIKGHIVKRVMVSPGADIAEEYYFSLLLDRAERRYLAMCSFEGGMDIETLAVERPEKLVRYPIDPLVGLDAVAAAQIVQQAGFPAEQQADVARVLGLLGKVYADNDATLVEVNPLVKTGTGEIIALDGKVSLDDNAAFRHDWAALVDHSRTDPLEQRAQELDLNYVKLDGDVGIIGNGAGLVMSTLDVVAQAGAGLPGTPKPANFLDIGGGASAQVMADGLGLILSDPSVKVVFVNVFGGITACSEVANGIVGALDMLGDAATKPIVVRLDGNAVEEGRHILSRRGHPLVTLVDTMDGAAERAAVLASAAA